MNKTCAVSGKPFEVSDEDLKFYESILPVFCGKKVLIPVPTFCPEERRRRRLAFRNERSYYKRSCDLCKKSFISAYSPEKPFTVYCSTCWWDDNWDAGDHAREFDFSRTFFEQFSELMRDVPRLGVINVNAENSDYTNYGYANKDCYLLSTCDYNEKCYFGCFVWNSYECLDSLSVNKSQFCYQCIDSDGCYECMYCQACVNCQNCFGCSESKNLKNCFGCVGLSDKEYCYFNEQLMKEEYEKRLNEELKDVDAALKKIQKFVKQFPRRATFQISCENSTGDHLKNCKNVFWGFDGYGAEDCKWITNFPGGVHHCYDFDGAGDLEWGYEVIASGAKGHQIIFSDHIFTCSTITYSSYCTGSNDLFASIGLKKKKYCILNKQYSKEEYEILVPKIIEHMMKTGEWGEFFPMAISPFAYNETAAQQVFPLTKDDVLKIGLKWNEEERELLKVEKIIPGEKLPKNINEVPDDILNWAIECEVTKKPFKIIPQELAFYRKYHLPIPTLHPNQRHQQRMAMRNPQQLWDRQCDKCSKAIQTSYSPDRLEKVYCEECYLKEVY